MLLCHLHTSQFPHKVALTHLANQVSQFSPTWPIRRNVTLQIYPPLPSAARTRKSCPRRPSSQHDRFERVAASLKCCRCLRLQQSYNDNMTSKIAKLGLAIFATLSECLRLTVCSLHKVGTCKTATFLKRSGTKSKHVAMVLMHASYTGDGVVSLQKDTKIK